MRSAYAQHRMCVLLTWQARGAYAAFLEGLRRQHGEARVKDGVFGAMMNVSLVVSLRSAAARRWGGVGALGCGPCLSRGVADFHARIHPRLFG